ncbi:hypothetical protein BC828DRAFT_378080 [Blastocladiella britannica]|nr:hypothetical protein BC828DRAFT_378080 [Blastocladiella britannica]
MDTSGELLTPTLHRLAVLPLSQSRRHVRLTFRRGHHIMPAMAATADHLPLFPRARISDTLGGTLVACAAHGDKAALQWCFDQYSTHRHPEWRSFFPRVAASAAVAGHRSVLEWMRDVAAPAIVMGHRDLDSKVDENLWDTAVGAISLESVVRAGQIETAWWCLDQFQWQKGQTTWHRQQWTWIAPRRRRIDAILSMVRGAASGGHLDLIDQCVAAVSDAADADSVAHDPDLDTDAVVDQTTNVVWVHALMSAAFAGQVPVLEHYMVTATSPIAPRHLVLIGDAALSGGHVSAADWCWDHLTHHQSGQQRAFCTQVGVYRAMHVSGRPMMDWIWDRTHGTAETMQGIDAEGNPVDIQWTSPVTSGLFDCTITVATLDWWLAASIANQWPMDPWLRSLVGQACRWDRPDVLDWLWSHQHHCSIEANMSGRGGLIGYELERHMVHAPKSTAMLDWYWTHREELGTPRIMDRVGGHLELALKSHDGRAGELLDWWIDKFGPEDRHLKAAVANAHRMASGRVLAWVMRAPAPVSDMAATDEELVARFVAGPSAAVSDLWLQYMLSTRTPTSLPWPCSAGFTAAATRRPISIERLDWWLAYNLSPSLGSEYDPLTTTRSMVRDTFPAAFENAMLSSHPAVGWWVDTMLRFGLPFVCSERTQLSRPIIQQMQAQGIVFYRKVEDEVVEWKDE